MTEPQVTMSGPAELRRLAELERRRGLHGGYAHADILMQDAAAWEADRDALNSETARADAAELRANVLGQRDETETMNIGAALFAMALRDDTGAGEMPAGPCADVLAEWRQMRAEINGLRASGSLLANQMRCKCGGQLSKLLACLECGDRYELVNQDVQARHMSKLHVFEVASQNAPPFAAASFQAVSDLVARAERAEAALAQARALVAAWRKQVFELPRHVTREIEDCADELAAALSAPDGAR